MEDEKFTDNHTENQRRSAAVITQVFAAMVKNDVQYGYIDTGEAMAFHNVIPFFTIAANTWVMTAAARI
ncbi:hypothetical protein E4U52_001870 [Claviceps spartinae]|nr:hypothetical protein E4U52_001870 [Claviceps spartinae]KAG6090798.1 hypothetical protein E4U31_007720 [Claviceps sp. LM219 group G6]KAG6090992.1 hypothetical protein E4U30_007664 [Claviceps sp. LM220 group G6]